MFQIFVVVQINFEYRQELNIGAERLLRCLVLLCIVKGLKSATPDFIFLFTARF